MYSSFFFNQAQNIKLRKEILWNRQTLVKGRRVENKGVNNVQLNLMRMIPASIQQVKSFPQAYTSFYKAM